MAKAPKKTGAPRTFAWASGATHIAVRAKAGPRWRAGRKFDRTVALIAKGDLADDEAAAIAGDAHLSVEEIDAV